MERGSLVNVLSTAFATAVWGTTYVVTTLWLPDGYPLWSGLLRALPAGLLGLALSRRLPSGVWWWRSLVLGTLTIGAFLPLLFVAAYTLPGGVAAVFGATQPLIVAGLALVVLAERPTRWRLAWALLAVVGVAVRLIVGEEGRAAAAFAPQRRTVIVTDETVAALHAPALQASLTEAGIDSVVVEVPAGEASKSFAELERVLDRLLEAGLDRKDLVIALGGGVVGDVDPRRGSSSRAPIAVMVRSRSARPTAPGA